MVQLSSERKGRGEDDQVSQLRQYRTSQTQRDFSGRQVCANHLGMRLRYWNSYAFIVWRVCTRQMEGKWVITSFFCWLGFRRVTSKLSNFYILHNFSAQFLCSSTKDGRGQVSWYDEAGPRPSNFNSLRTSMSWELQTSYELRPVKFWGAANCASPATSVRP
jgi:hypothetical protein